MARGHRLNTSIVLAAVLGLLGLPCWCAQSSLHSLGCIGTYTPPEVHPVPGMRVNTGYMTETPPEVHLYEDAVEFMYLVLTRMPGRGCTSGGVYIPCIYTHAR